MAFPDTPLPVLVEMKIGSTFTNITSDVLVRDEIDITRGKQPEAGQAAPQTCRLTLNNRAGKYSPRNPLSPYYGQIGRNTELRVAIEVDPVFDAHSSTTGTGNLSWTHTPVGAPTGVVVFVWQFNTSTNQIQNITYGGIQMRLESITLHTLAAVTAVGYMYSLTRGIPTGPQTVAVTTSATTQRQASAVTVTGGTNAEVDAYSFNYSGATPSANPSINLTTSKRSVLFGSLLSDLDSGATIAPGAGYTELVKTALGTEVVDVERATVQPPGSYTVNWTAASGGWGVMAIAIRTVYYRFWGEVSSFPPKWDTSAKDAYVPIEASGVLRRLGQGTEPGETGLRNFIYPKPNLWRYWPLSGASGTQYSLDIAPMWGGPTNFRFYSEAPGGTGNFGYGTDMGSPFLGTGMAFFNSTSGPMRGDAATGEPNWAVDFVFSTITSTGGMGSFTLICPGYDGIQWELNFNAGVAQVKWNDTINAPTVYPASSVLPALQDLGPHHVRFQVTESVTQAAQWTLFIDGVQISTGTQTGYFQNGLAVIRFYMTRAAGQERINLAHLAVWSFPTALPGPFPAVPDWPSAAAVSAAAKGYAGETAGTRISRICGLAAVPVTIRGVLANTTAMGPQYSESMLTQIREAESTDLGILAESRDALGLLYQTRASLYNLSPKATISMSAGELAPPFEPVDDDQATRNDITTVRRDGNSVRLADTTSRLSTAAPPAGVGPYKDEVTLNVETDALLQGSAGWLLNLGTVDEARFPYITVDRTNRNVVANTALSAALMAVDIGDRIAITNATQANIYDDISVIALGYNERLSPFGHTIVYNCTPEDPYRVAVYGSGVGTGPDRYDTGGSSLTAGVSSTATSLSVTSATGNAPWTTTSAEFPFDIFVAGERMRVTNITSATSPQTFTVTRSINGVVKAQSSGAAVALWKTPRYAL